MTLTITELLSLRGLDIKADVKMLRHQDQRFDLEDLQRKGLFELYQSTQGRPILECDYVVSFMGEERSKARLYGVYRVKGKKSARGMLLPSPTGGLEPGLDTDIHYELEELPGFEDLKHRVVIDWGAAAISWHQWLSDKAVIEIRPPGYVNKFPGYPDCIVFYDDLVKIMTYVDTHRDWHTMLRAVAGVYLIVDTQTGKQYVGSAYGEGGLLGRWMTYSANGHGGNEKLIELLASDPSYARHFQFSILETLPRTLTSNEVIDRERCWKKKLGTRAFGLTSN